MTGNNLSSQAASSPVLSTRESLTAVFGMGTGGASQPSSPDSEPSFCVPASSSLRLACPAYPSMPSLRSLAFPRGLHKNPGSLNALPRLLLLRITPENPHSSFRSSQTFKTLQKKLLTHQLRPCFLPHKLFKSSPRRISTGPLNTLLHLHSRPINLVFCKASY